MLHACTARFDVRENLKKIWFLGELNKTSLKKTMYNNFEKDRSPGVAVRQYSTLRPLHDCTTVADGSFLIWPLRLQLHLSLPNRPVLLAARLPILIGRNCGAGISAHQLTSLFKRKKTDDTDDPSTPTLIWANSWANVNLSRLGKHKRVHLLVKRKKTSKSLVKQFLS